jgi:hypothetical protein
MHKDKFAIFIDAENLISWIKDDGPAKLLDELSSSGQVIVRRAYGKWTNSNLNGLQEILSRNGFELLHKTLDRMNAIKYCLELSLPRFYQIVR